ncbi:MULTISPECIES: DNA mismatch repair endonuclease MutL [unclassified Lactococcus]|uniref:DNA mismatch repair endonuclease MutL n=1 Tax=unclassified Lactococcus TaxID=2643510 RepID=UPI0011C7C702|nr:MULTISPECIES: DNA mismatch repair endonuclease MutL [unclassified Lactococcus]MQW23029.1 DNA mismatch repair endonuclease MutL [Lactococcus sp. dk101]TXK44374.1 DNA mismatch repair endonuclease MutL [Lactococcus sp. dk310]TXK50184.1 DNA mismatch repair endonuclease MutL [Lactococcus sp. dk322]
MGKIIELDEALANQIAAGEVVERPASVVKELVENSIDAGSTKITVKIEEAGLKRIEVVDNGTGIEKSDVSVALKRHATSKIKDKNDLFRIRTLGFRGEAIPSIASVSDFSLETSVDTEASGTKLVAHGGVIATLEPTIKRAGTKISVENLFFNTPARLKYIRSLQAELSHITDILNRLSLAHPEISFSLLNNGHELLKTTGSGDLRQVIAAIYGIGQAKKMRHIEAEDLDFKVTGYISLPELTRSNQNYMTLLVNGRYIKNFLLRRAILEGYGNRIMVGRYPLAVLSIEIDPQLADVNVHPTKQEIRLSKEKELMALISQAIVKTLSEGVLIPDALENFTPTSMRPAKPVEKASQTRLPLQSSSLYYDKEKRDFFIKEEKNEKTNDFSMLVKEEVNLFENPVKENSSVADQVAPIQEKEGISEFPHLEYLAQLHRTYLLCQAPEGLYLIDQHAAQERVNYEYWKEKIGEVSIDQQILLTPYYFELPKNDALLFNEQKDKLHEAGIFLEEYGENKFILRENPVWLKEADLEKVVYEMIDIVLSSNQFSLKQYRHDLAAMVACKSSIKAGYPLDDESARTLIKSLEQCENPYSCAHGRPTIIHFSDQDVQKMFRRIQENHRSKAASWKDYN